MIYDLTLESKTKLLPFHLSLSATNIPPITLLLLSQQTNQELSEHAQRQSHLTIKEVTCFDSRDSNTITLPRAATKIQTLTIEAVPDLPQYLETTLPWIKEVVVKMADLRSLSVNLIAGMEDGVCRGIFENSVQGYIMRLQGQRWTDLPKLEALRVLDAGKDVSCYGEKMTVKGVAELGRTGDFKIMAEAKEVLLEG